MNKTKFSLDSLDRSGICPGCQTHQPTLTLSYGDEYAKEVDFCPACWWVVKGLVQEMNGEM